jgi:hypothetical protein
MRELEHMELEPRSLGRSDYPTGLPLHEVLVIARHCAGGIVLGFSQFRADSGEWKQGTPESERAKSPTCFPTPWNHLESGIMFTLGMPVLVFREKSVSGGVFDHGVSDVFVHLMPSPDLNPKEKKALRNGVGIPAYHLKRLRRSHKPQAASIKLAQAADR